MTDDSLKPRWMPIDSAPKVPSEDWKREGPEILVYSTGYFDDLNPPEPRISIAVWDVNREYFRETYGDCAEIEGPTHWQPLPEPPQ